MSAVGLAKRILEIFAVSTHRRAWALDPRCCPSRGGRLHRLAPCRDRRAMNIAVAEVPVAK
jgi:hypothetical protein